ncbi:MAG: riboflavin synthase [Longimicrobiales bacterium]|nr:riboflavin synthase [Longimicrobiales bacterium]
MFTGIVEAVGRVQEVREGEVTRAFWIASKEVAGDLAPGESVSVDGACLTVTRLRAGAFAVDVIGTTLRRTIAGRYETGTRVNLERAARLGDRLDGHIVQGHVDGIGYLKKKVKDGDYWLMDFSLPPGVHAQSIDHGSVTLNGVSLTVSELLPESGVRIGVIPYTHAFTNLGELEAGDPVNVEGDLIGKYVARMLASGHGSDSFRASEQDA